MAQIITDVADLTDLDVGKFFRYEYLIDQGKGEITNNDNGMYEIRGYDRGIADVLGIITFAGIQYFDFGATVTLYDQALPQANN